jgi:hypothetical protein
MSRGQSKKKRAETQRDENERGEGRFPRPGGLGGEKGRAFGPTRRRAD